uniref:Uncharacterized protein n=1 Tax=Tanacetum cinerariifolium TaxID=118510 RepID=A0A699HGS4_TANCI|nr:hypothetical protein [Tanacetum cinerariifolium]
MACSVLHTDDEIEALIQKLIDEDMVRQKAIMDLALQFENACTAKEDLRKAYKKCGKIEKQMNARLVWLLEKYNYRSQTHIGGSSSQTHEICDLYLTDKKLHQLHLDEEVLRETLEEEANDEKEQEEKIRQKQADDEFFLEFRVVKSDSEYGSD